MKQMNIKRKLQAAMSAARGRSVAIAREGQANLEKINVTMARNTGKTKTLDLFTVNAVIASSANDRIMPSVGKFLSGFQSKFRNKAIRYANPY